MNSFVLLLLVLSCGIYIFGISVGVCLKSFLANFNAHKLNIKKKKFAIFKSQKIMCKFVSE